MNTAMTDEELEELAKRFVREIREVEQTDSEPEFNIGLIVAHSAIPASVSVPSVAVIRYGICVSVGALVGYGLTAVPTALALEKAFGMARGRALRFLKFEDAAVLDWCWRNCSHDLIDQGLLDSNFGTIRDAYDLAPHFDEKCLAGSLDALERNGSIISKPTAKWRLAEEVRIFG